MKKIWNAAVGILALALAGAVTVNTWMTVSMYRQFQQADEWKFEEEKSETSENDVTIVGYGLFPVSRRHEI